MGESFSDDDLRELQRLLQQVALKAYPNPEREGCPGSAVLHEVASVPAPFEHPAYEHIKRCSPCLQEMLDLRRAKFRARQATLARKRKIWGITGVLAACVILVLAFLARSDNFLRKTSVPIAPITLQKRTVDLFEKDVLRGPGGPNQQTSPVYLPAVPLELRVILPRFSRPGTYQIAVCRDRNAESTLVKAVGPTNTEGSREIATVIFDLSKLRKGSYWLSTRYDDNDASDYFALQLQ